MPAAQSRVLQGAGSGGASSSFTRQAAVFCCLQVSPRLAEVEARALGWFPGLLWLPPIVCDGGCLCCSQESREERVKGLTPP